MTEERDAHLREALRHAPDAQLQPPPALSALILSEAHAKARDGAVPTRPPRSAVAAVWSWLARPSVATGFAGVMVATLVGVMWWDQPMDEAQPRRPGPATTAAAPAPVVIASETPPPVATPSAPTAPLAAEAEPAQPPRTERRKGAPAAERSADKKMVPAKSAEPATVLPTAPPVPPTESRAGAAQALGEATTSVAAQAAPAPAFKPAPAPAAMAPPAATLSANATADPATVAGGAAKSKSDDRAKLTRSLAATDAVRSNAAGKLELNESRLRKEAEAAPPKLASLRAAIAAEPARWGWQRDGGAAQDMNDAVYAWLAQLDNATGSTWQGISAGATAPPTVRELRLLRDGRVMHSLRLTDSGVLWSSGSSSWQAELPAAALQALGSTAP
ncbi:MAG: hypothetical protein ABI605_00790 [Rhizobacter sp.]